MVKRFYAAGLTALLLMLLAAALPAGAGYCAAAAAGSMDPAPSPGLSAEPEGGAQTPPAMYAVVNNPLASDRLHLRASASLTAQSLGTFGNGDTVEVLEAGSVWCRVRADGQTGYMLAAYLLPDSSLETLAELDRGRNDIIGPPYPVLREAPSENAPVVRIPDPELGGSLLILSKAGTWYYVEIQRARGFYPANRVMPGAINPKKTNIAVVTGPDLRDRLNLRAAPSETAAVLGKYFAGTQVEVLDYNATGADSRENAWYRVKAGGIEGYMRAAWLQDLQTGDPSTW